MMPCRAASIWNDDIPISCASMGVKVSIMPRPGLRKHPKKVNREGQIDLCIYIKLEAIARHLYERPSSKKRKLVLKPLVDSKKSKVYIFVIMDL